MHFLSLKHKSVSIFYKGEDQLIEISKQEAEQVREKYPLVHIRRTVHKFYMEESKKALLFIDNLRRGTNNGGT